MLADRRLGGVNQPGNRFVSFVRAYARSGCLVETGPGSNAVASFLFPGGSFPFPTLVSEAE